MTSKAKAAPDDKQEWFTPSEAAEYLRVTRQTIYNYMDDGLLPYYDLKVGRGRRLRRIDLDGLLTQHKPSGESPASDH